MSAGQGRGRPCLQPAHLQAPMLLPSATDFGVNLLAELNATGHSGHGYDVEVAQQPMSSRCKLPAQLVLALLRSTLEVWTLNKTGQCHIEPTLR